MHSRFSPSKNHLNVGRWRKCISFLSFDTNNQFYQHLYFRISFVTGNYFDYNQRINEWDLNFTEMCWWKYFETIGLCNKKNFFFLIWINFCVTVIRSNMWSFKKNVEIIIKIEFDHIVEMKSNCFWIELTKFWIDEYSGWYSATKTIKFTLFWIDI